MNSRSIAALLVAATLLTACGTTEKKSATTQEAEPAHKAVFVEALEPYECGSISRMHTFSGIFLASQPQPADFEQAKMGGVKTVINQRHAAENKDFDERKVIADLGLEYYNPAFNGPDQLTDKILDETRELFRTAERPMLVHCSSANRTGATWLAYRVLDEGLGVDAALEEAKIVGLRSADYERIVLDYIKRRSN